MKINFFIKLLQWFRTAIQKRRKPEYKKMPKAIQLGPESLPQHIAIVMDGNGRWATRQGKSRIFGHKSALTALREVVESCSELGVSYLTLFAFSTENWERPQVEVDYLMALITEALDKELAELVENKVRLRIIGDIRRLPGDCQEAIQKTIQASQHNEGLQLTIALSYSGRWDITEAARAIARQVHIGQLMWEDLDTELLNKYLATEELPDPELLIRTSGEQRLSNFLLWQLAYTELYFTSVLWPDFRKYDLLEAILAYQKRDRRFGKKLGT